MLAANKASIPGNNELDAVSLWAAFLQGKVAMIYSWPPTGRRCELFPECEGDQFHPAIIDRRKGRLRSRSGQSGDGDRLQQGSLGRFNKCRAAYLFMQWAVSPPVSLARTMLPYSLRDPYRLSHYKSELYRSLWPDAPAYLINLCNSANVGLLDMVMPGWQDYA